MGSGSDLVMKIGKYLLSLLGKAAEKLFSLSNSVSRRVAGNMSRNTLLYLWLFHLVLVGLALGGTWSLWAMPFTQFMLGALMLSGGILILAETLLQQGVDTENPSFWTGGVTGLFGAIYGIDLMAWGGVVNQHFGGVQGGILLFMFVIIALEGYSNADMFG